MMNAVLFSVSLIPSLHSQLFLHVVKKNGREPGQICQVKCVISTGMVCGCGML